MNMDSRLSQAYNPVDDGPRGRPDVLKTGRGYVNESGLSRKVSDAAGDQAAISPPGHFRQCPSELEKTPVGLYRRLPMSSVRDPLRFLDA